MKSIKSITFCFFAVLFSTIGYGQNIKKADKLFYRLGYQVAIPNYGDSEDLSTSEMIRLATAHRLNGDSETTEMLYRNIINRDNTPIHYYHFAMALLMNNKADEALSNFAMYKSFLTPEDEDKRSDNFISFINSGEFDRLKNHKIEALSDINTDNFEYSPHPLEDGLVFVSSRPYQVNTTVASATYIDFEKKVTKKDIWTEKDFNKIFKSNKDDEGNWSDPTIFSDELVNTFHIGPFTLNESEDEIYFTASQMAPNTNNTIPLDILYAVQSNQEWSAPVNLDKINTEEYNEAHPALSADGTMLVFASDRDGGMGGMDLYISMYEDDTWSDPINLGPTVNTPGNELFPSLRQNGQLHFASDGLGGYGGLDIFEIEINNKPQIGRQAINLGAPINSNQDDFGFVTEADLNSGYFTSSRGTSDGRDDIYSFELKEDDPEIEDENIDIVAETEEEVVPYDEIPAIEEDNNTVIADADGNENTSGDITIAEDISFTLDKIYYDFDKATLRDQSIPELNKLTQFLNNYPDVTIELSAHTDSRGDSWYNESLSQKRAESVVQYLLSQSIHKDRIIAKGYGEDKLRNECYDGERCSEKEHEYNRRTEFRILNLDTNINLAYTDNGPNSNKHHDDHNESISFSNISHHDAFRLSQKYQDVDVETTQTINDQLSQAGDYMITVGAYSDVSKKQAQMQLLGFDKIKIVSVPDKPGLQRVILGAMDDMKQAYEVSSTLYSLGIKNDVLTLD